MPHGTAAVTIGNFDGVHIGHGALVRRARSLVDVPGARGRVIAMAFDPHPFSLVRPEAMPARLTGFEHRAGLLREAGADEVVRIVPDAALISMTPESFIESVVKQHQPRFIVEGDDFHFGKGRAGNTHTLERLGPGLGFEAEVVGPVDVGLSDHLIVRASSSIVRWLIAHGRMLDASLVLGRPYELRGMVVRGDQRGREIGFATANLSTDYLLPADGVYAGTATLPDGRRLGAAINVGTRPTFDGIERRAEAHLLDSDGGAPIPGYGWELSLEISSWVRDDLRFDSVGALIEQIRRDCDRVRTVMDDGAIVAAR